MLILEPWECVYAHLYYCVSWLYCLAVLLSTNLQQTSNYYLLYRKRKVNIYVKIKGRLEAE